MLFQHGRRAVVAADRSCTEREVCTISVEERVEQSEGQHLDSLQLILTPEHGKYSRTCRYGATAGLNQES